VIASVSAGATTLSRSDAARLLVNLIGYALMVNGLAVYLHRKRRSVEEPEPSQTLRKPFLVR